MVDWWGERLVHEVVPDLLIHHPLLPTFSVRSRPEILVQRRAAPHVSLGRWAVKRLEGCGPPLAKPY